MKDFLAQHTKRWWALYHNITDAEAALEPHIAALGLPYRFQYPTLGFFADFAIPSARIIIEVDGSQHRKKAVVQKDEERTAKLNKHGWTVVRVENEQALKEPKTWVDQNVRPLLKD